MKKVLAVSSGGGHWTQLMIISDAFIDNDVTFITTSINPAKAKTPLNTKLKTVIHADINQKVYVLILAVQMLYHILCIRPDVVISTGAAPGFFAIVFSKIIGSKTIWLDSIANYERLSLAGTKVKPFCDQFLTQWPHLSAHATYWGKVL